MTMRNDDSIDVDADGNEEQKYGNDDDDDDDGFWDLEEARKSLRSAVPLLRQKGLLLASKWASEQLLGLPKVQSQQTPIRGSNNTPAGGRSTLSTSSTPTASGRKGMSGGGRRRTEGVNHGYGAAASMFHFNNNNDETNKQENDPYMYDLFLHAESLFHLGEYENAAYQLSQPYSNQQINMIWDQQQQPHYGHDYGGKGPGQQQPGHQQQHATNSSNGTSKYKDEHKIGPPLKHLSPQAHYLRAYALYLSGERRKEEEMSEISDPLERTKVHNVYLRQLKSELSALYRSDQLDAFGIYVYGIVLKELQKSSYQKFSSFHLNGGERPPSSASSSLFDVKANSEEKETFYDARASDRELEEDDDDDDLLEEEEGFSTNRSSMMFRRHHQQRRSRRSQQQKKAATNPDRGGDRGGLDNWMCCNNNHVEPEEEDHVYAVLLDSLERYPYNWSAWLDLASVCVETPTLQEQVDIMLQNIPQLSNHWMYHMFLVHLFRTLEENHFVLQIIDGLRYRPASVTSPFSPSSTTTTASSVIVPSSGLFTDQCDYLKAMEAVTYYNMGTYDVSMELFAELYRRSPFRLEQMDMYSNILYVNQNKARLSDLARMALRCDKYRAETCCILANYYSLKGMHAKAVKNFQRAIRLDSKCHTAYTLMGHEYIEFKNSPAAIEAYRRAVDINPRDYRAWYGLGQTYELMKMPMYAKYFFQKAVSIRPYDSRMWCALGTCSLNLDLREDAIRCFEHAIKNNDKEGVATQKLATLYRDDGLYEKAANCYQRHLMTKVRAVVNATGVPDHDAAHHPHLEDDGRYYGGGDGASVAGGGQRRSHAAAAAAAAATDTMLLGDDDGLDQIHIDATEAEAILFLAWYHKEHNNLTKASRFCSRLLEYPGPENKEAKGMLREIRSTIAARGIGRGTK